MDVYGILQERFPQLKKERDFSFAKHTFIGCGGTAAVALSPSGIGEAAECLDFLEEQKPDGDGQGADDAVDEKAIAKGFPTDIEEGHID